jgi:hypothetical protein
VPSVTNSDGRFERNFYFILYFLQLFVFTVTIKCFISSFHHRKPFKCDPSVRARPSILTERVLNYVYTRTNDPLVCSEILSHKIIFNDFKNVVFLISWYFLTCYLSVDFSFVDTCASPSVPIENQSRLSSFSYETRKYRVVKLVQTDVNGFMFRDGRNISYNCIDFSHDFFACNNRQNDKLFV